MSSDVRFKVVLIDSRRWYICPVPRCGFRVPVDGSVWSTDAMDVHVEIHHVGEGCTCGHVGVG